MENSNKQTALEWAVDFYTRKQLKFEIRKNDNVIQFHVWHESMWSPQIVESVHYYDKNGNEIRDESNRVWVPN